MLRSIVDALRLVWPITGGYRVVLPGLVDRAWPVMQKLAGWYRRLVIRKTRVIAVAGSLGKTTTRRALEAALGGAMPRHSASNFGVRLVANLLRTRPWHAYAVLEVGIARPGWMGVFAKMLAPDVAVVTSIRSEHNRAFPTLEATRAEKVRIVHALPPHGLAVLNGDDPHVRWMATQTRARVLTFGLGEGNDVRAAEVRLDWPVGTRFTLHAAGQTRELRIRLFGRHMVYPILAAVAVALAQGLPLDDVVARVESVEPTPQRLQPIRLANGATILSDTFKGALESVVAALETLSEIPSRRRLVILGDIEEPPSSALPLYRELGARLARCADRVILIGSHNLKGVVTGAGRAGMPRDALTYVGSSIHEAIALVQREATADDVILIKGAGSLRLERISLALQGRVVRCPVKMCKVRAFIACEACPLLARDHQAFENIHLRKLTKL